MSRLEDLPPDLHAVLSLLLRQRRDPAEVARMLGIEERAVHDRAHAALVMLAPRQARELTAAQREQVGEYLLSHADPPARHATRAHLESSASARGWAQALATELAPLARDPLPEIPTGSVAAEGVPAKAPAAPTTPQREIPTGSSPAEGAATPTTPQPEIPTGSSPAEGAAAPTTPQPAPSPTPLAVDPPAASSAAESEPPVTPTTPPSSRVGGMVVLGVAAAIAIAAVVLIVGIGGGGGSHTSSSTAASSSTATTSSTPTTPTTPATSSTPTTTSTTAKGSSTSTTAAGEPRIDATLPLTSPNPADKALGIVEVVSRGSQRAFIMVAEHLPPTTGFRYAAWLYDSPSDALLLGSGPKVGSNGILKAAGGLPANAASFHQIVLTEERTEKPTQPGPTVLSGAFKVE